jgi:hypothetical protein
MKSAEVVLYIQGLSVDKIHRIVGKWGKKFGVQTAFSSGTT